MSELGTNQLKMLNEQGTTPEKQRRYEGQRRDKNQTMVQAMNDQLRIKKQVHQDILNCQSNKLAQARNKEFYQNMPYFGLATGLIVTTVVIIAIQIYHKKK